MKVYRVSELTDRIKTALESEFPQVVVEGEISNWRPASSGHAYFSLKDADAVIQAVMFRNRLQKLTFQPKDGSLVRLTGQLSVYAARGNYQIIGDSMEVAGIGDLLLKLEALKRKLAEEGLFDAERKRPLPRFPSSVAVVTSPTGAALRDILNVLGRRNGGMNIVILPSLVQGAGAAESIATQLATANRFSLGEVIIVARGGGSIEDLMPFSEERVVRAVASSRIPVISAVGHETDWSLCDFAADLRAPTPSAAAELVAESTAAIDERISFLRESLERTIRSRLERARLCFERFSPENLELQFRKIEQPWLNRYEDAKETLVHSFLERLHAARSRISVLEASLEALSPRAILERGYAIVSRSEGGIVRSIKGLRTGDTIKITMNDGSAVAETKEIIP